MPRLSTGKMTLSELVALRDQIQRTISDRIGGERASLQKQLEALSSLEKGAGAGGAFPAPKRRGRPPGVTSTKVSARAGKKVAPKYRGPEGEIWTGRGNTPRWLVALEKAGKSRESFLIAK